MAKCTWITHECDVNDHAANWNAVPGLYIFAGLNSEGRWAALYIGQAESLAERIPSGMVQLARKDRLSISLKFTTK